MTRLLAVACVALAAGGCRPAAPFAVEKADPATLRTVAEGQVVGGAGQ